MICSPSLTWCDAVKVMGHTFMGHTFMTSIKNEQFCDSTPNADPVRKNEQ